jgi:superfamily I DNA/RNA helicase
VLVHRLAQIVLPVYLFVKKDQTQNINDVDCVKIMSIVHAKGLEFDGVVLFGHGLRWGADIGTRGKICQNRLYVATSRPTKALSVVTQVRATIFDRSIDSGNAEFLQQ